MYLITPKISPMTQVHSFLPVRLSAPIRSVSRMAPGLLSAERALSADRAAGRSYSSA
jgi:hypothetical protein